MFFRILTVATCLLAALWSGCAKRVPPHPPALQPPVSPVEGVWQSTTRKGNTLQMMFKPEGTLTFQGGLEYYNPGRWDWNPMRKELTLALPEAPDEKLQIFKLYVGDGVKAFDRLGKTVTFDFTDQTDTLNIAGWTFTKAEKGHMEVAPEPVLK